MRKVARKGGQRKPEVRLSEQTVAAVEDLDARVEMIQALIPMGLKAVEEELQGAVAELAGPRYRRGPEDRRYYRWGRERGSVYLADQKVAVRVPRVRDVHADREVRLGIYERLQEPRAGDAPLMGRILPLAAHSRAARKADQWGVPSEIEDPLVLLHGADGQLRPWRPPDKSSASWHAAATCGLEGNLARLRNPRADTAGLHRTAEHR